MRDEFYVKLRDSMIVQTKKERKEHSIDTQIEKLNNEINRMRCIYSQIENRLKIILISRLANNIDIENFIDKVNKISNNMKTMLFDIEKCDNRKEINMKSKKISPGQIWRSKRTNHTIRILSKAKDDWWLVRPSANKNGQHKMQEHSFHFYELVTS